MMHERNPDARWLKPLGSLNFVGKTSTTKTAILEMLLDLIFVFKQNQKIVLGINDLSVIQMSNLWRVVFKSLCLLIDSDTNQSLTPLDWGEAS